MLFRSKKSQFLKNRQGIRIAQDVTLDGIEKLFGCYHNLDPIKILNVYHGILPTLTTFYFVPFFPFNF